MAKRRQKRAELLFVRVNTTTGVAILGPYESEVHARFIGESFGVCFTLVEKGAQ